MPVPYDGRIAYFESSDDASGRLDPRVTWGPLALGALSVHPVPGDHNSMMLDPANVEVLARELRTVLEDAESVALSSPAASETERVAP